MSEQMVGPPDVQNCMDCGWDYPLGLIFSRGDWLRIRPEDWGMLCPNCMCQRVAKLPNAMNVIGHIEFARPVDQEQPAPEFCPKCGAQVGYCLCSKPYKIVEDSFIPQQPARECKHEWEPIPLFGTPGHRCGKCGVRRDAPRLETDETAWVVERYRNGRLEYFEGRGPDTWTSKHQDAMRFAREEDASRACGWLCNDMGRAAQHAWVNKSI